MTGNGAPNLQHRSENVRPSSLQSIASARNRIRHADCSSILLSSLLPKFSNWKNSGEHAHTQFISVGRRGSCTRACPSVTRSCILNGRTRHTMEFRSARFCTFHSDSLYTNSKQYQPPRHSTQKLSTQEQPMAVLPTLLPTSYITVSTRQVPLSEDHAESEAEAFKILAFRFRSARASFRPLSSHRTSPHQQQLTRSIAIANIFQKFHFPTPYLYTN